MKKLMLFGRVGAGKTTLTQALRGEEIKYFKTQYVNYLDTVIDTPGEYTAEATGFRDAPVKVTMTFDEKSITGIVVDASSQTENIGGAAVKALEAQVMAAQSSAS